MSTGSAALPGIVPFHQHGQDLSLKQGDNSEHEQAPPEQAPPSSTMSGMRPTMASASQRGIEVHYDTTSFRSLHNKAIDKNTAEHVEEHRAARQAQQDRALATVEEPSNGRPRSRSMEFSGRKPKPDQPAKSVDFDGGAGNESASEGCWYHGSSNGASAGTATSIIKSKISPVFQSIRARSSSIGSSGKGPLRTARRSHSNSFDSFDGFPGLGPPAEAEEEGPQERSTSPSAQKEREPRKKEMSDLSEEGLTAAACAAANSPARRGLHSGNGAHHQDNNSQESGGTGQSTIPPEVQAQQPESSPGTFAAAAAGTQALATAGAVSSRALAPAPSHDSSSEEEVMASLGLSRRHMRRASHPPRNFTPSEMERGINAIFHLKHLRRMSSAGVDPFEDNDVVPDPKSVTFGGAAEVSGGAGGTAYRSKGGRQKSDSNLSALEWAMNPLEKEQQMINKIAAMNSSGEGSRSPMGSFRGSFSESIKGSFRKKKKEKKKKGGQINERSRKEYFFVLGAGMCLAFNSGYINGACLSGLLIPSAAQVSVSAFTGSYTKSALGLASGDAKEFGFLFSMILCFICGSMLTAIINPRAKPYELGPQYGPTFLLGSLFLVISSILSELDYEHNGLFYFAAAANGLQNGMSSSYSGNLIRSSHYTGISTDMGLILGQVIRGNRTSLWKLWVLLGLTSSFWMGGFCSWHATSYFRTHSLIFNACFFALIGAGLIIFVAVQNQVSLWQAAFGTWQWERALDTLASVHSVRDSFRDSSGKEASEEFLMALFDKIDTDRSGTIDEDELYDALKEAGMKVSRKGIKAMMKLADEDGDGHISREEWAALVGGKVDTTQARRSSMTAREAADKALKDIEEAERKQGAGGNEEDAGSGSEWNIRNEEETSGGRDIEEGGNGFQNTSNLPHGVSA